MALAAHRRQRFDGGMTERKELDLRTGARSGAANPRVGYSIAIALNLVMLFITQNILEWGWVPFLTGDFALVEPWISLSLTASIIVNVIYQFDDTPVVKAIGQILVDVLSVYVTVQILTVFPFDFSAYVFDWEVVARVVLILAAVGAGIGALVEFLKLLRFTAGRA
jgi:hypothetical protein